MCQASGLDGEPHRRRHPRGVLGAGDRGREQDLPAGPRADLADQLRVMLDGVKGRLVLAEDTTAFRKCHNLDDLVAAAEAEVRFATLSPIYPTRSKPGYGPPLGLAALARMAQVVPLPVYALGGVDSPQRVRDCLDEGATGVAVMGAVMRAEDPARFVKLSLIHI